MKKLLFCITLCLIALLSCNNSEQLTREKEDVSEILYQYNGATVRAKSRYLADDGYMYCMLQLAKNINGERYDFMVKDLPEWVWDDYELDDTINCEISTQPEEIENEVKEDSIGQKTIVIDGVEYVITEKVN